MPAVILTVLEIGTLVVGFVAFCGAMIGASKHFDAEPAEAAWKSTLRFAGRAGLVLFGAGLLAWVGHLLDSDGLTTVSILAAVVAAFAAFIRALAAGTATRRWISEAQVG